MAVDVMIVDDSAAIRKILQRMLVQAGLNIGRIVEANDGLDALEKIKVESIGLILSDVNMPNMDGIAFLSALKSKPAYRNVPFVLITMEGGEAKVMEALQLGAAGYVRKPFTVEQIRERLSGLI